MRFMLAVMLTASGSFLLTGGQASPDRSQDVSAPEGRARRGIAQLRDSLQLPGLQVVIGKDDVVVVEAHVGFADVEARREVTSDSRFRIGSVSKLLTATAAARLHQAGPVDLDVPIGRYLPGVPADKAAITSRQLAGHVAGLGHYDRNDYINTTSYRDVAESLRSVLATPLLAEPGSRYAYSSYGYNILGAVLQEVAGRPFPDVVAAQVLSPLRMTHTSVERSDAPPVDRVRLYSKTSGGDLVDAPRADLSDRWPSGGFVSTALDLTRLARGVVDDRFLRSELSAMLFASQRTADGKDTGVGLGWRTAVDPQGRRYVHHGGDTIGGRAFVLLYPSQRVSVVLLTNVTFAPIGEQQALELAQFFLEE